MSSLTRQNVRVPTVSGSPKDVRLVADAANAALSGARQLREHWRRADAPGNYGQRFELIRTFNALETSFGFFDNAAVDGRPIPVIGSFEEMLFDRPKSSETRVYQHQLREFVLRYLMRVSDFRLPIAYADPGGAAPAHLGSPLSWCPDVTPLNEGFGYSQWYYKSRATGDVGRFPEETMFQIVDLREIGREYEWIMVRVKIWRRLGGRPSTRWSRLLSAPDQRVRRWPRRQAHRRPDRVRSAALRPVSDDSGLIHQRG